MSLSLTEPELKTELGKIQSILINLQSNFKDFEDVLKELDSEKNEDVYYLFDEFQRHGQELIDFLTDKKIEELYEKK